MFRVHDLAASTHSKLRRKFSPFIQLAIVPEAVCLDSGGECLRVVFGKVKEDLQIVVEFPGNITETHAVGGVRKIFIHLHDELGGKLVDKRHLHIEQLR